MCSLSIITDPEGYTYILYAYVFMCINVHNYFVHFILLFSTESYTHIHTHIRILYIHNNINKRYKSRIKIITLLIEHAYLYEIKFQII